MSRTVISSREFNHAPSKAKKAAALGLVFITDRGEPAYVLLSMKHYKKIADKQSNIADLLAMSKAHDVEFKAPKLRDLAKAADFS